jgi:hypothetical protein
VHVGNNRVSQWITVGYLSGNAIVGSDLVLRGLGDELRPVVGSDVFGHGAHNELIGQHIDHVGGLDFPFDPDGQTLVWVNSSMRLSIRYFLLPPFVRAILDEVIRPAMVRSLAAQTDAEFVVEAEPAAFGLLDGDFSRSRRQIRTTACSLTTQPARARNSSAIFR